MCRNHLRNEFSVDANNDVAYISSFWCVRRYTTYLNTGSSTTIFFWKTTWAHNCIVWHYQLSTAFTSGNIRINWSWPNMYSSRINGLIIIEIKQVLTTSISKVLCSYKERWLVFEEFSVLPQHFGMVSWPYYKRLFRRGEPLGWRRKNPQESKEKRQS